MQVVTRMVSQEARNQVFISYARDGDGGTWVARFSEMLDPVLRKRAALAWHDANIRPGQRWRDEIGTALARTKVALLLVNAAFLASKFILEVELPTLLDVWARNDLAIVWVLVGPCAWQATPLAEIQCANDAEQPLAGLEPLERDKAILKIAYHVDLALS
jgi:hypothetical protein